MDGKTIYSPNAAGKSTPFKGMGTTRNYLQPVSSITFFISSG